MKIVLIFVNYKKYGNNTTECLTERISFLPPLPAEAHPARTHESLELKVSMGLYLLLIFTLFSSILLSF
jgi:hypothetical protein